MNLHVDHAHFEQFKKYREDKKIFIETGTNQGNSSYTALQAGFESVISVEIVDELYNYCMKEFQDFDNVTLFHGDSKDCLPKMLDMVDEPAFFWIDSHFGYYDGEAHTELDILKEHHIKTHTIMIDDLPQINDTEGMVKKLKDINLDYNIEYLDSPGRNNYKMIAYIK
jgi:hypothetical protein